MHLTIEQAWDKNLIRRLAEQVVPEPISSLDKLPGGGCHNYEINRHIILKLPMTDSIRPEWMRQADVTPVLQTKLSVDIPHLHAGTLTMPNGGQVISVRYEKISGASVPPCFFEKQTRAFKVKVFEQLADVMIELHRIRPDSLPVQIPGYDSPFSPFYHGMTHKRQVLHGFILNQLNSSAKSDQDVLCHSDLHSDNLCLDGTRLKGILDFDLMLRGRPETEFRPNLYSVSDMKLWADIYSHRSGRQVNSDKIRQMQYLWIAARSALKLYRTVYPARVCAGLSRAKMIRRLQTGWALTR